MPNVASDDVSHVSTYGRRPQNFRSDALKPLPCSTACPFGHPHWSQVSPELGDKPPPRPGRTHYAWRARLSVRINRGRDMGATLAHQRIILPPGQHVARCVSYRCLPLPPSPAVCGVVASTHVGGPSRQQNRPCAGPLSTSLLRKKLPHREVTLQGDLAQSTTRSERPRSAPMRG